MGKYIDFAVKYNPQEDKPQQVSRRIIYSLVERQIKARKPIFLGLFGDSGEGKSETALTLQEVLLNFRGLNAVEYYQDMNIHTPFEYAQKMHNILFDKRLKDVNIVCMHEARDIVKASKWQAFLAQTVADINAQSRSIKRLCFMIVSQFIGDITRSTRLGMNYYITVYRPIGDNVQMTINKLWKDDSDIEKPRIRKRRIRGYLIYPDGSRQLYSPKYFKVSRPSKELIEVFEKADYEAKAEITKKRIEKLILEMKIEQGLQDNRVDVIVNYYTEHPTESNIIGKRNKRSFKVGEDFVKMYNLTDAEKKEFERKYFEKLKTIGATDEDIPLDEGDENVEE